MVEKGNEWGSNGTMHVRSEGNRGGRKRAEEGATKDGGWEGGNKGRVGEGGREGME